VEIDRRQEEALRQLRGGAASHELHSLLGHAEPLPPTGIVRTGVRMPVGENDDWLRQAAQAARKGELVGAGNVRDAVDEPSFEAMVRGLEATRQSIQALRQTLPSSPASGGAEESQQAEGKRARVSTGLAEEIFEARQRGCGLSPRVCGSLDKEDGLAGLL